MTTSPSETLSKADSVLPRFDWDDERKRKYLSYRLCGFGRDEARKFAGGIDVKTIYNWRQQDEEFQSIEQTNLLTLQRTFSEQVVNLDFTRNFKLALELDFRVLVKANEASQNVNATQLTKEEREYLIKIRPLYTPAAFAALQDMFAGLGAVTGWDEVLAMRKPDGSVTVAARKNT
ncbi:hypothetical protein LCGC14_1201430 [marine sediment metagenome]|uniref:Uncharacterized protein n=1 Tax=marine sediment metagenome TaxID=412755 RepID=A0A0F9NZ54_9ZZZZ